MFNSRGLSHTQIESHLMHLHISSISFPLSLALCKHCVYPPEAGINPAPEALFCQLLKHLPLTDKRNDSQILP